MHRLHLFKDSSGPDGCRACQDRNFPVHISDVPDVEHLVCGVKRQRPGYRFSTGDYDHFQVIVVLSGRLWADWGDEPKDVGPHDLLLLPPGSTFELWCEGRGYRGIGVNIHGWERLPARPSAHPGDAGIQQLTALIERVLVEAEPGSGNILRHLGAALCEWSVRLAARRAVQTRSATAAYWAERARQAIENHLRSDSSLADILAGVGLCYRQLARHFESHLGISPKRYQMLRRVEEAGRLLERTDHPVTAIAMEFGFASSQHFCSCYRQITGQSPTQARTKT